MLRNKICVLDDDHYWLRLLSAWAKKVNYEYDIITYNDHNEFLNHLDIIIHYECIIIDYFLHGITADAIIPLIKKKNPKSFVLCTSSKFNDGADFELMKKVLNSGATRVCPKNLHVFEMILDSHSKIMKSSDICS
jgi:DNA-binding NtrC family response regulator